MTLQKTIRWIIAGVWFVNGLFCKVLNLVPRHEAIVSRILGASHSRALTILIGIAEVFMGVWVLSQYKSRLNAILQIVLIATMNTLEFIMAPDLLLWGRFNALFAFLFILAIYYYQFELRKDASCNT